MFDYKVCYFEVFAQLNAVCSVVYVVCVVASGTELVAAVT